MPPRCENKSTGHTVARIADFKFEISKKIQLEHARLPRFDLRSVLQHNQGNSGLALEYYQNYSRVLRH